MTGTFPTVWNAPDGTNVYYAHFIDANTFYALATNTESKVYKCSIGSGGALTVAYQSPPVTAGTFALYAKAIDGVVHIFVKGSGIEHFVDDGAAIVREGDAWNTEPGVVLTISGPLTSCSDFVQNQDETDVDCGATCSTCSFGKKCNQNSDCSTDLCMDGICGKCIQHTMVVI